MSKINVEVVQELLNILVSKYTEETPFHKMFLSALNAWERTHPDKVLTEDWKALWKLYRSL